ncbi:MAG: hypothetical protein ACI3VZ_06855 [Faecousia sp.]
MGSVNNKRTRNLHASRFIQAVFAARLREEGFVCPNDKLLCWYRLPSDEIVNSICFFSSWPNLPLMLEVGYGIHPLFVKPFSSNDVYLYNTPFDERFYTAIIGDDCEKKHYAPYSSDICVYALESEGRGIGVFDHVIFPQMNSIKTIDECYLFHQKEYRHPVFCMSTLMIDEAIMINDIAALENCQRSVDKMISFYDLAYSEHPNHKAYHDKLLYAKQQKAALTENARDEYLAGLEKRASKNLCQLKKWGVCP